MKGITNKRSENVVQGHSNQVKYLIEGTTGSIEIVPKGGLPFCWWKSFFVDEI